jgi:hypothetical protein
MTSPVSTPPAVAVNPFADRFVPGDQVGVEIPRGAIDADTARDGRQPCRGHEADAGRHFRRLRHHHHPRHLTVRDSNLTVR